MSALTLGLTACGQQASAPAPTGTPIGAGAADADAQAAAEARAAELAAREQELAEREAALKQQEADAAERARLEAEAVAAQKSAAEKAVAARKAAAAAAKPAIRPVSTAPAVPAVVAPIFVPAGTPVEVALSSSLTTKQLAVGTPVTGMLASDVVVDGRRAARAGSPVQGTVTEVVSGSNKIGGIPKLAIRFDTLVAADGSTRTINAPYFAQGRSETAKDTAKIAGGAVAGAVIGHQVDDDKGRVIGGLLGAGAGAIAAQKTGGEIVLGTGEVLTVSTTNAFEVRP